MVCERRTWHATILASDCGTVCVIDALGLARQEGDLLGAEQFGEEQPALAVEEFDLLLGQFHGFPPCCYAVVVMPSFRDGPKDQTRNLEIPRCAIAHLRSGAAHHPGMTAPQLCRLGDGPQSLFGSSPCGLRVR